MKEIHNAIVTRNIDQDIGTALRGAVFFEAPTLFEGEYPLPAFPCFPFASVNAGFFVVPRVNDEIVIEIEVDDPNNPEDTTDVELPEPRWRCMIYSSAAEVPEEFLTNYPFRSGWKTHSGHLLMFDDTEGQELVRLSHKIGSFLEFTSDGDYKEKAIRDFIASVVRDSIETIGGKKVFNITGNCEINCLDAKIIASGDVDIAAGGDVIVAATGIELNGSASPATSKAAHLGVIDLITGTPLVGTSTVLLDV